MKVYSNNINERMDVVNFVKLNQITKLRWDSIKGKLEKEDVVNNLLDYYQKNKLKRVSN